MTALAGIEARIAAAGAGSGAEQGAAELLSCGEEILRHWIEARGESPVDEFREGFRLLALHRQGTRGDPSFNACRETCREIAFHFNLITMQPGDLDTPRRLEMMRLVTMHLFLFVSGKMEVAELGEFCCSSRPIRLSADEDTGARKEA